MKEFLNLSRNSKHREVIFKYALFHDLKLSASSLKSNLKFYEQEVDNEGCDIIIEDGLDFSRKIQLKSIYESQTRNWQIHKNILLPSYMDSNRLGLDVIACPSFPSAFILIDAQEKNESNDYNYYPKNHYTYYFIDYNIICLIALGVIKKNTKIQKKAIEVFNNIANQFYYEKLNIPKGMLLKTKGPLALLKLLGMCGDYTFIDNSMELIELKINKSSYIKRKLSNPILNYNLDEQNEIIKNREKYLIMSINNTIQQLCS